MNTCAITEKAFRNISDGEWKATCKMVGLTEKKNKAGTVFVVDPKYSHSIASVFRYNDIVCLNDTNGRIAVLNRDYLKAKRILEESKVEHIEEK